MADHPRSPDDLRTLDDASLVRLARRCITGGGAERETANRAMAVVYLRRSDLVRAVVAAKVPREAADDVTAQVWARFTRTAYRGAEIQNPAGLLMRIAQRVRADHFGRRDVETSPLDEWSGGADDAGLDDVGAAECIDQLLAPLTERQREVVRRRIIDGEPSGTVAKSMGTTPGNIDVIVHRSLRRLQEEAL